MHSLLFIERHSYSIDKRRKFSRKRPNEDTTGDITYINEKNRIFNKKVESSLALEIVGLF